MSVRFKHESGGGVAEWPAVAGAMHYEVRLHSPVDGRALRMQEVRDTRAILQGHLPEGAVLSVRPRCAHAFGEAAFGFVTR